MRLDLLVSSRLDLSRTAAATLIANGHVTVNGRREKASYRPAVGERIAVDIPPPPDRPVLAEDIPLTVVWEDEHALVVDKPAGMVVHPAPGNWTGTLVNALKGRGQALSGEGGDGARGNPASPRQGDVRTAPRRENRSRAPVARVSPGRTANQAALRRAGVGSSRLRSRHGRQADRPRSARPKADGDRQYGEGRED